MSSSRSDAKQRDGASTASDPLRPSDHIDAVDDEITQPKLGFAGWLRWGWRQLTSMRVALVLLLILAIAAIPGSIFPQRTADPNGVIKYKTDNPDLFPILDKLSLFDVYSSPWFSAIYLLLFISLIGCIIPASATTSRRCGRSRRAHPRDSPVSTTTSRRCAKAVRRMPRHPSTSRRSS